MCTQVRWHPWDARTEAAVAQAILAILKLVESHHQEAARVEGGEASAQAQRRNTQPCSPQTRRPTPGALCEGASGGWAQENSQEVPAWAQAK